jgi:hypothetical protein
MQIFYSLLFFFLCSAFQATYPPQAFFLKKGCHSQQDCNFIQFDCSAKAVAGNTSDPPEKK